MVPKMTWFNESLNDSAVSLEESEQNDENDASILLCADTDEYDQQPETNSPPPPQACVVKQ